MGQQSRKQRFLDWFASLDERIREGTGATQREIARVTGISRHTIRSSQKQFANYADASAPGPLAGAPSQTAPPWPPTPVASSGVAATVSACERHRAFIEAQLQLKRNAMAIYQDLVDQFGLEFMLLQATSALVAICWRRSKANTADRLLIWPKGRRTIWPKGRRTPPSSRGNLSLYGTPA